MISANALPGTSCRLRSGATQAQVEGTAPYDNGVLLLLSSAVAREDGLDYSFLRLLAPVSGVW